MTGNGLKSIAINLSGIKADAYTGELALNKTALALKEIAGIDVYSNKQKGQIKDMVSILDELYNRWGDFTEEQQRGLAEAIAGKEQSKVFQSLMTNYKDVLAVREQLANQEHFGSAEAENTAYLDSISGKLNALKQTWISILNTFANSESIKDALDVLISVSEAIDSVVKALDEAGILMQATFGVIGSGGQLLKNLAGFGDTSYQIKQIGDSIELVSTKASAGSVSIGKMFKGFSEGTTVTQKLGNGFKTLGGSITSSLIPSFKGMLVAGLKGVLISAVFTGIGIAIDKTINKYKNLDKELQSQADTSKAQLESLNQQKSGLESIAKEYDTLAQKTKKTAEEVQRFNELKGQIAEIAPELVIGYDSDNNPILNLNGSLEEYIGNLDSAIDRQKTLFANDSLAVGKNALDGLKSNWNWNLASDYSQDDLALSKQNDEIIRQRQQLVTKLNHINNQYNFKSFQQELSDYANQNDKYNKTIVEGYQKVKKEYDKIAQETAKAQQGMSIELMNTSEMKQASDEVKKLGAQMISAFDLSEIDSSKLDQMIFNMSKNLSSGEFDSSLKKVVELREELEKTYNFKEYEENIEQYIPSVAKFLGVTEEMAREMLKVPEIMKSSEDALDQFLRSIGKTKQSLNFDAEAQNLANQFYEVENAISQLTNSSNLIELNGKVQLDPQIVLGMQNNESIPEQIRNLLGIFNKDGVVDFGEVKILMDVMTAFKLGDTQESQDILTSVQKQLDELLGEGVVNIKELKFDVNGKVENVNIDKKELEEKLSVFGDREEIKAVFRADVVGLDKVDLFAEIVEKLPADKEYTTKFIADNAEALSSLNSYQEVIDWIAKNPEVINTYKIDVTGNEKLEKAKKDFESSGGEKAQKVKVETNAEEAKKEVENFNKEKEKAKDDVKTNIDLGNIEGSAEALNQLVKASEKLGEGKYKISFDSDVSKVTSDLENLSKEIDNVSKKFDGNKAMSITIDIGNSAKNIKTLATEFSNLKTSAQGIKPIVFSTDTATASKNVTGLRNNVSKYVTSYCGKSFSTRFNTETALASKNVTGLRNNVSKYVNSYGNKTFTTTFKVVTSYSTQGTPTAQSAGAKPSGQSVNAVANHADIASTFSEQIQADTVAMQRATREGVELATTYATKSRAITQPTPLALTGANIHDGLKYSIELLKELEARLSIVGNKISVLDKKMQHATNSEKLNYLKEQNKLYEENIAILNEQADALQRQKNYYEYFLKSKGFKFNIDGNMTNYEEKLLAMEKEKERLDKIAEDKQKASSDYKGDDDKQKEKLSKAYEEAKKKADDYSEELSEIKKFADEYYKVAFDELPKVTEEFVNMDNAIKDNIQSIKEFEDEIKKLKEDSRYKDENRDVSEVQNKLDKNEIALETAIGKERKKLLKERIQLQEQLKKETEDLLVLENQRRDTLMTELGQYGFTFREDGSIEGYGQKIEQLKNSLTEDEFDKVFEKIESYLDTTYEQIPNIENELLGMDSTIKEIIAELENVDIEQIDKDIDRTEGDEELLELLYKKKELQEELTSKKKEYLDLLEEESSKLKESLEGSGIRFTEDGDIENLEEIVKKYQDAINSTNDTSKKNALKKELDDLIKGTESYVKITESEIPKAVEEWKDAQHSVNQTNKEIEDIEKKQIQFQEDKAKAVRKATEDIMKVSEDLLKTQININRKQIDMLEKSMELASFNPAETFETLEKQVSLLEQQMELQSKMGEELEKQKDYYKNRLVTFGIQFDDKGIAKNAEKVLNDIKNQMANASDEEELEKLEDKFNDIVDVLGDYNGALESIVDNQSSLMDIQLEIQAVYENMLQTTKQIEDKITSILEKQVEERKKLIDSELEKRLEALKKEQEAYNKNREEEKYAEKYEEKLKEIADLKAKIETVSKDTSLSGQAKLAELLKQLEDKQKEFDDMVQDKLDEEINDKFQQEQDRLEEEADKAKEELDKTLEKEPLYEAVKEALETGKIKDIDGNLIDIKDAIFDYEDKYGDGLSVIGGIIKKDLLSQLDVSLDTMKNIEKILSNLNISDLYPSTFSFDARMVPNSFEQVKNVSTVNFNQPLITVQGNVTKDSVNDLERIIKQAEKRITENIINATR